MLDTPKPAMTLREYWTIVVRRRLIVAFAVLAAVGVALGVSFTTERLYRASASAIVRSTNATTVFGTASQASNDARRRIANEISLLEGVEVRQRVRDDLGLAVFPPQAQGTSNTTDDVVVVEVVSSDRVFAATVANAYIEAYNEVKRETAVNDLAKAVDELQGQISRLQDGVDAIDLVLDDPNLSSGDRDLQEAKRRELVAQQSVFQRTLDQRQVDANLVSSPAQLVQPATIPSEPFQPTPLRTGLLGLLAGLVLGLGAALLRDRLDQSIKVAADIEKVGTTLTVLAQVPPSSESGRQPISATKSVDPAVESYRSLRTSMQFVALDRAMKVLQVTSAIPGEGKTTTATNLAVVMAQAGTRVMLIDGDLRKPMVHESFGIGTEIGLVDNLVGLPIEGSVQHVADNLDVIPAGRVPANPSEMLSSRRMAEVVEALKDRYDFVIIDSAPVLPVSDAAALSRHVDGVLVVAQAGQSTAPQVRHAIAALDQVDAPLIGIVLNKARLAAKDGYGYGYGSTGASRKQNG